MWFVELQFVVTIVRSCKTREQTVVSWAKHLQTEYPQNSDRELAQQKLLAAGFLVTSVPVPDHVTILSPDELLEAGRMPNWARSTSELIDGDRDNY